MQGTKFVAAVSAICCVASGMVLGDRVRDVPPLFENGATEWKVLLPKDAAPCETNVAKELTNALFRVSGARFRIVSEPSEAVYAVKIRCFANEWAEEKVEYRLDGRTLLLTGNSPQAAMHAAYAFMQRELGVRWLWPGEDGAFFPPRKSWRFPAKFGFSHTPSIRYRGFHHCGAWRDRNAFLLWQTRNFANVHRHAVWRDEHRYGNFAMPSSHNANLNDDKRLFAEHPECFALLSDGKRSMLNICFSSDLAAEKIAAKFERELEGGRKSHPVDILSVFPNDNADYCQCPSCKAAGVSSGWFGCYEKIVSRLRLSHPETRYATIAYQGYRPVPETSLAGSEFVEFASHGRCYAHKMDDPNCKYNVAEKKLIESWCRKGDVPIGHYTYEYDLLGPRSIFMPFFSIVEDTVDWSVRHKLVTLIPEVSLGPNKVPEVDVGTVKNRLTILFYAWKMWDASLTFDRFLNDLTACAYGSAAAPMKEYFKTMDAAWQALGCDLSHLFVDGAYVSMQLLKDDAVRAKAERLLAEAERLSKGDARSFRNVRRERALYLQICRNRELRLGQSSTFNVPRVETNGVFRETSVGWKTLKDACGREAKARVRGFWQQGEKDVVKELVLEFDAAKNPTVEIYDENDACHRYGSEKAVRKGKRTVFRIPAAEIGPRVVDSSAVEARFMADGASYPAGAGMTCRTYLSHALAVERPFVYVVGDKRCFDDIPGLPGRAEEDGWKMVAGCRNATEFLRNYKLADTYMIRVPSAPLLLDWPFKDPPSTNAFPKAVQDVIRERVKAGGTLLVRSWYNIPLPTILGDTNYVCHVAAPQRFPLGERKAKWVRDGNWTKSPWNIDWNIRVWFAPCYMQVPDAPVGAWRKYAAMPASDDHSKMIPFISAAKYGKGAIIIVGEAVNVSHFRLIDNIRRDLGLEVQ